MKHKSGLCAVCGLDNQTVKCLDWNAVWCVLIIQFCNTRLSVSPWFHVFYRVQLLVRMMVHLGPVLQISFSPRLLAWGAGSYLRHFHQLKTRSRSQPAHGANISFISSSATHEKLCCLISARTGNNRWLQKFRIQMDNMSEKTRRWTGTCTVELMRERGTGGRWAWGNQVGGERVSTGQVGVSGSEMTKCDLLVHPG